MDSKTAREIKALSKELKSTSKDLLSIELDSNPDASEELNDVISDVVYFRDALEDLAEALKGEK